MVLPWTEPSRNRRPGDGAVLNVDVARVRDEMGSRTTCTRDERARRWFNTPTA
jgi:hypothetical protein